MENKYHKCVNVFKNVCAVNFVHSFIVHIEVVRRLHTRKLAYIALVEPLYIPAWVPVCILALVLAGTFAVAVFCILAWGSVGMLGEVLGDTPVWEHFDKPGVAPFGILVLEFGYKLVRVFVRKLLLLPFCILDGVLVCTPL